MKKLVLALVALFTMTIQASAMSYKQAREQALFLTDKMAYELNLTDEQYEAAYEINLDYLMGVNSYDDLYGAYWTQRNLDLSYILLDWQYRSYLNASYFYRPLYWDAGYWHFGIYARYPHRDYYFFGCPSFYVSYRGGHSWSMNGGCSWYYGRNYATYRTGESRIAMRDGFNRGDYGRGVTYSSQTTRSFGNSGSQGSTRSFGNEARQSSTRTTVTRPSTGRSFGNSSSSNSPSRTFTPNSGSTRSFGGSSSSQTRSMSAPTRSGSSFGSSSPAPSRNFGGGSSNSRTSSGGGHFGRGR